MTREGLTVRRIRGSSGLGSVSRVYWRSHFLAGLVFAEDIACQHPERIVAGIVHGVGCDVDLGHDIVGITSHLIVFRRLQQLEFGFL
jgi:hypothetical protein